MISSSPLFASQRFDFVRSIARSAGMKPLDPFLNITGHSIVANAIGGTAPSETQENYGFCALLPALTGGRVRIGGARKSATPGHTTKDWLDNLPAYIAAGGDVFPTMIGTNDRNNTNNFSLNRSKRNIEAGIRMLLDEGKIPLWFAELPRGGDYALTGDQLSYHKGLREWQLTRLPEFGVRVVDAWPALVLDDELALPIPEYFVDQLHPAQPGGILIAKPAAPHLIELFGAPLMLPTYNDPYDATNSKAGWLTANPLMLGTGGTKSASANAIGEVADNWNVAGSSWTGGTVRCYKEPNPDGGEFQCFELGGTPTSAGSTLILEQVIPLASLANGNTLRGIGRTAYSGLSGVGGVSLDLRFVRSSTAYFMKSQDRYAEGYQMSPGPENFPQETPHLPVDMTETEIKLRAVIYGCQNVPIRGIVKIGQCGSEKIL